MKDIRSWLGKHMRPNQEALLTRMALTLNEKKKARVGCGRKKASNHVDVLYLTEHFGIGPVKYGVLGQKTPFKSKAPAGCLYTPSGKIELTDDFQYIISTSCGRVYEYYLQYYFLNLGQVKRPNKQVVNVRRIPVKIQDIAEQDKLDLIFYTSTKAESLAVKCFTKDNLFDQVKTENKALPENKQLKVSAFAKSKIIHATAIVKIRTELKACGKILQ
eukprot:scaffold13182_cov64-Attheya_sp.AAC.8